MSTAKIDTQERSLFFTVGDQRCHATLSQPTNTDCQRAVLFLQGWSTPHARYAEMARAVAALGCVCLTFDRRGQGASEGAAGTFSRADHFEDALKAYDILLEQSSFVKTQPAENSQSRTSQVIVCGVSYGASLAPLNHWRTAR